MNFNTAVDGGLEQVWNLRMEEKKCLRRTPSSDLLGTPSTALPHLHQPAKDTVLGNVPSPPLYPPTPTPAAPASH